MMKTGIAVLIAAAAFVVAAVVFFLLGIRHRKNVAEKEISPKYIGHATHNKKDHNSLNDCVKPNFFHTILLFTNQLTYPLFFITYPQKCG